MDHCGAIYMNNERELNSISFMVFTVLANFCYKNAKSWRVWLINFSLLCKNSFEKTALYNYRCFKNNFK